MAPQVTRLQRRMTEFKREIGSANSRQDRLFREVRDLQARDDEVEEDTTELETMVRDIFFFFFFFFFFGENTDASCSLW